MGIGRPFSKPLPSAGSLETGVSTPSTRVSRWMLCFAAEVARLPAHMLVTEPIMLPVSMYMSSIHGSTYHLVGAYPIVFSIHTV